MVSIVIRKPTKPVDDVRERVLELDAADMAMMRDLGTLVPVTAHVEEGIRRSVASRVFESDVSVLRYVAFGTPWVHVEGAASLDLVWGQCPPRNWDCGGVDGCTASQEDEESCLPPHGDGV